MKFFFCSTCVNGTLMCTDYACPVYGPWGDWSECSVSCGTGQRTRTRSCTSLPSGPPCSETVQNQTCALSTCPGVCDKHIYLCCYTAVYETGGRAAQTHWCFMCLAGCVVSEWSSWGECSVSCGGGMSVRRKNILQEQELGGLPCPSLIEQHITCNTNSCLSGEEKHTYLVKLNHVQ